MTGKPTQRVAAEKLHADGATGAESKPARHKPSEWQPWLEDALYASKLCSYAQGMAQLRAASQKRGWELRLAELATIW